MTNNNAYARLEKHANRLAATGTAWLYDCADYGTPVYRAMTAYDRYVSLSLNPSNVLVEVSSLAVAERLATILNRDGEPLPLIAAHKTARRMDGVRWTIARRNDLIGRAASAAVTEKRAIRTGKTTTGVVLSAHVNRALAARRARVDFAARAVKETALAAQQLALLDPTSAESLADAARTADLKARFEELRTRRSREINAA